MRRPSVRRCRRPRRGELPTRHRRTVRAFPAAGHIQQPHRKAGRPPARSRRRYATRRTRPQSHHPRRSWSPTAQAVPVMRGGPGVFTGGDLIKVEPAGFAGRGVRVVHLIDQPVQVHPRRVPVRGAQPGPQTGRIFQVRFGWRLPRVIQQPRPRVRPSTIRQVRLIRAFGDRIESGFVRVW